QRSILFHFNITQVFFYCLHGLLHISLAKLQFKCYFLFNLFIANSRNDQFKISKKGKVLQAKIAMAAGKHAGNYSIHSFFGNRIKLVLNKLYRSSVQPFIGGFIYNPSIKMTNIRLLSAAPV